MFVVIGELITWLIDSIRQLGWIGVITGVLAETFLMPVPSSLVPLAAGFLLIPQGITLCEAAFSCFFTIGLAGSIGATLGAFFGYGIGYFGGRLIIGRYGRYLGVSLHEIEKISMKMRWKNNEKAALILLRAIPLVPLSPVSLFAGLIRVNLAKFTFCTFVGAIPRFFVLGLSGWFLGETYMKMAERMGFYESTVLMLMITAALVFILYKIRGRIS